MKRKMAMGLPLVASRMVHVSLSTRANTLLSASRYVNLWLPLVCILLRWHEANRTEPDAIYDWIKPFKGEPELAKAHPTPKTQASLKGSFSNDTDPRHENEALTNQSAAPDRCNYDSSVIS
jgi:hypothetical protein